MAYFLVVEVPDAHTPLSDVSRDLPGVALDVVVQAPAPDPASFLGICEVRGGSAADRDLLASVLRGADPKARQVAAPAGCLRLLVQFPAATMAPVWKALARFAADTGLHTVWATLENGVTFLRILAPADRLTLLESGLQEALRREGFDADVATEAVHGWEVVDRIASMGKELGRPPGGAAEGF